MGMPKRLTNLRTVNFTRERPAPQLIAPASIFSPLWQQSRYYQRVHSPHRQIAIRMRKPEFHAMALGE